MIGLFKQKSPGNIVVLLLFGLLLKLPFFLQPKWILAPRSDGGFYQVLIRWMEGSGGALAAGTLAFLLLYIQALIVNHAVNEYRMTARPTYLPAMAFLVITSLVPEWNYLSGSLIASTFIIWAFSNLFKLYQGSAANGRLFNIGLLVGVAALFYYPAVLFFLCLLIGYSILRPFRLNELFLLTLGLLTPFYFAGAYLFLTDQLKATHLIPRLAFQTPTARPSYWLLASIILASFPFLMGGYYIQTQLRKMLIQARKNWSVFLLYVLLGIFIPFVNNDGQYGNWVIVLAPVAAFHACAYLYPPRRWVSSLLFLIMLIFILAQQYGSFFWPR